jgi:hypothetical protein
LSSVHSQAATEDTRSTSASDHQHDLARHVRQRAAEQQAAGREQPVHEARVRIPFRLLAQALATQPGHAGLAHHQEHGTHRTTPHGAPVFPLDAELRNRV